MEPATWIFGYASLMWRPDFRYAERRVAHLEGWARRFWQGSTAAFPGAPGRVVTLRPERDAVYHGVAFRIEPGIECGVLEGLDHRERGGFERLRVEVRLEGAGETIEALTWVAHERNPNDLGPAPLDALVGQVRRSRGPRWVQRRVRPRAGPSPGPPTARTSSSSSGSPGDSPRGARKTSARKDLPPERNDPSAASAPGAAHGLDGLNQAFEIHRDSICPSLT